MAKRMITKIGDIFCVEVSSQQKRFFQYVADDLEMLNSEVIRVFKKSYPIDYIPDVEEIVKDDVEWYAHTVVRFGAKEGDWYKVGKNKDVGDMDNVRFRLFPEVGPIKISHKWYVWKVNEEYTRIGDLTCQYKKYDLGYVYPPFSIVKKIRSGKFQDHAETVL